MLCRETVFGRHDGLTLLVTIFAVDFSLTVVVLCSCGVTDVKVFGIFSEIHIEDRFLGIEGLY